GTLYGSTGDLLRCGFKRIGRGSGLRNRSNTISLKPPRRLRTLSDSAAKKLRVGWILLFLFALAADIGGVFYSLRDAYQVQPLFARVGLDYTVQYQGDVLIGTRIEEGGRQDIETQARLVAIDGKPVSPDARIAELFERLEAAPGPSIAFDLRQPDGSVVKLQQLRTPTLEVDPTALRNRDMRMVARFIAAFLACASLLLCSLLLALRRPNDPVAMLFAFAFAGMAATIDPPLQMWMGLGLSLLEDVLASAWFYLLLIALAVFPDGIFVPRPYRWLLVAGVPLAIFLSLPDVDEDLQAILGIGTLLAMLVGQVIRYRRLAAGIARQQLKYAAFGFAAGLLLVFAAFVLIMFVPDEISEQVALVNLTVLLLFSLGMAVIPLGLLVALTRFRLWEADAVITRSAAYAVVTVVVGVVWAASADLVKLIIAEVMGSSSEAGATTVGAIIAAGIFSPTQSVVLGWTERRFGGPLERVHGAVQRLKRWGLTEVPAEVASRALSVVDEVIHPAASAIVLDGADGLAAARGTQSAADPALIERLILADEEGPVGALLLARRSDGNRYNRHELEAVNLLAPAIADALRAARSRHSREAMLQDRLEEMAARLTQLEGGAAKPA
ncbi:MAG: hypothetical protein ABIP91_05075, partial [Sphingomicrobium sp.]